MRTLVWLMGLVAFWGLASSAKAQTANTLGGINPAGLIFVPVDTSSASVVPAAPQQTFMSISNIFKLTTSSPVSALQTVNRPGDTVSFLHRIVSPGAGYLQAFGFSKPRAFRAQ